MSADPHASTPTIPPLQRWSSARCMRVFALYLLFFTSITLAGLTGIDVHPSEQIRPDMIVPAATVGRVLRVPQTVKFISPPLELAIEVDRRIVARIPLERVGQTWRLTMSTPIPAHARVYVICTPVSLYTQIRLRITP